MNGKTPDTVLRRTIGPTWPLPAAPPAKAEGGSSRAWLQRTGERVPTRPSPLPCAAPAATVFAMTREQALRILEAHAEDLWARGVRHIALFGSTARDEARPDSDIDVLVDLDPERNGWQDYFGLHDYLEGLFGCAVDMVQRERLKPFLRDRIIAEAEGRFVTPTPPRSPRQPLEDMLDAINWISEITSGKSLVDYRADRLIRDAVERNVERLSEASRRLPDAWKADYPNLPWKDIAAIGSILRHAYDRIEYDRIEYDRIEDDRIWSVVIDDLPPLRAAVLAMIAACKRTGSP